MPYSIILTNRGEKVLVDNDVADYLVNKSVFLSAGYPSIRFRGDKVCKYLHRVVMDAPKELHVDHINHDKFDCRRSNLRLATNNQNMFNKRPKPGKKYKGVSLITRLLKFRKKWQAKIHVSGKSICLGHYATELEAAMAYNEAAKKHFGEFAWLNPEK